MNRTFSAAAALVLMGGAVVAAAGKNDPGLNAYQRFHGGPPLGPIAPQEKPKPRPSAIERRATETVNALRAQEEANLLRRLAICDRIKQVALEQSDSAMEEEAMRMEQKAEEVYRLRTKNKPKSTGADAGARK